MAETDVGRLLLDAHRVLAGALASMLEDRGFSDLRPAHASLFLHVDRRSGTRLTELARRSHVTKQAMMQLVDELEDRGFVRRVADPADARAKLVRLTARGRSAAAECRRAVQALDTRTRRSLGARRFDALCEALDALVPEPDEP